MLKTLSTLISGALLLTVPSGADESDEASKLDVALAKYERTGEMKTCINPRRIRDMKVVDENHIIFRVSNKRSYLNTLPRRCHNMDFYDAISYQVRGSSICSRELFQVIDRSTIPGPFCSFGKFEKIVKKPSDQEKG